jgi:predicted transposase/invertase (TIGR01784 family)
MPDDEIVQHRRIALLELMQKHIRQRDLLRIVDKVSAVLLTGFTNDSQLNSLFNYLLHSPGASDVGRFIQEVAHRVPQHKEALMTNGEKLQKILRRLGKREGRIEGRIEGKIEGKIEGRIEGEHAEALRIARTLLEDGMAMESVLRITGLTADDIVVSHH